MQDSLDDVSTPSKERIADLVTRQQAAIDVLNEAVAEKDAAAVVAALKNIAKVHAKLQEAINELPPGDPDRAELEKNCKELEALLQKQVAAAKAFLRNPNDAVAQGELESASAALRTPLAAIEAVLYPSTFTRVNAADSKVDADITAVSVSAKAGKYKETKDASDKLKKDAQEKAKLAEEEAKNIADAELRKEILAKAAKLKELTDRHDAAVAELAKNPNDAAAQKRVAESAKRIGEWSDEITDLLKDAATAQKMLQEGVNNGDKAAVKAALDALREITADVIAEAHIEAKEVASKDPKKAKEITDAIARLEAARNQQEETARYAAAHKDDAAAQQAAKQAQDEAAAALAALQKLIGEQNWKEKQAKKNKKKNKGETEAAVHDAERALQNIKIALAKNDPDGVADALQILTEVSERLPEAGFSKYIPDLVAYVANPEDKAAKAKALEDVVAMEDSLDLVATKHLVPRDRLTDLVCRQEAAIEALNEAAAANDAVAIVAILKDIAKTQAKIQAAAAEVGKEDPSAKATLDANTKEMEALIQATVNATKVVLQDANNAQAKQELAKATAELKVPLTAIAAKISPSSYTRAEAVDSRLMADVAGVDAATRAGNAKTIKDASDALVKSALDKARLAEEVARENITDPELKREILAEIAKLKPLIVDHINAVDELAKNPNDPALQKKVSETAKRLAQWANDVTDLLSDSAAAQHALILAAASGDQGAVTAALNAIHDACDDAIAAAREEAAKDASKQQQVNSAVAALQEALKQQDLAARNAAAHPDDPDAQKALRNASDVVAAALAAIREISGEQTRKDRKQKKDKKLGKTSEDEKDNVAEKAAALREAERLIAELNAAIIAGDAKKIEELLKDIAELQKTVTDPTIQKLLGELAEQAKKVAANPSDEAARAKATELIASLQDAIDAASASAGISNKDKLSALVLRQQAAIDAIEAAAAVQDTAALVNTLKSIAKTQAKISAAAADVAKEDPNSKAVVDAAARDAEAQLQKVVAAAKAFLQNPNNKDNKDALDSSIAHLRVPLSTIEATVHPSPYTAGAALDDQIHARAAVIESAAKQGDTAAAKENSDKLAKDAKEKAKLAIAIAGSVEDPATQAEILDKAAELEDLLSCHAAAVAAYNKNPKDVVAQNRLVETANRVEDWADDLSEMLNNTAVAQKTLLEAAAKGDKIAVQAALDAIAAAAKQAIEDARTQNEVSKKNAKGDSNDPLAGLDDAFSAANEKKLNKAVADLEEALDKQAEAARYAAAHPDDKEAQKKLKEANAVVAAALNHLDEVKEEIARENKEHHKKKSKDKKNESAAHKAVHEAIKAVAVLQDKVNKGDAAGAAEAARNLEAARKKAVEEAQKAAKEGNLSEEDQDALQKAIDALNAAEGALLFAAKDALKKPEPKQLVAFSANAEKTRAALNWLDAAVVPPAGAAVVAAAHNYDELQKSLDEANAKNDSKKALEVARKMVVEAEKALVAAYDIAESANTEAGKEKIEAKAEELAGLLAEVAEVEKELAQNPNNARAQKRLVNLMHQVGDAIHGVSAESGAPIEAEVERLKRIADQLAAELASGNPSPAKVSKLAKELNERKKALQKLVDENKDTLPPATQEVVKQLLQNLDDKLNLALAASVAVVKGDKSKAKDAAKALEEVGKAADDVAAAFIDKPTHAPSQRAAPDEAQVKAAEDIAKSLPELLALAEAAAKDPNNKELQDKLAKMLESLPLEALMGDAAPEEKLATEVEILQDRLADLEAAVNAGDAVKVTEAIKAISVAQPRVAEQAKAVADNTKDEDQKALVQELAADIQKQLPAMIAAAKEFAVNPKDEKTKNKVLKSKDLVAEDAHLLKNAVRPSGNAKAKKTAAELKNKLDEIDAAIAKNDTPKAQQLMKRVKKDASKFVEQAQVQQSTYLDPNRRRAIGDAIADLEKKLAEKNGKSDLDNALSDRKTFAEKRAAFQKALDDVITATDNGPHDAAAAAAVNLKKLSAAAKRGDAQGVVKAAKAAAAKQNEVASTSKPFADAHLNNDQKKKDKFLDDVKKVEENIPQVILAAKELLANPNNEDAKLKLDATVAKTVVPLREVEAASSPNPSHADIEALSAKVAEKVLNVSEAARKGDKAGVAQGLKDLEKIHEQLKDKVEQENKNPNLDAASKSNLAEQLADLDALLPGLSAAAKDAAENKDDAEKQAKLSNNMMSILDALALLEEGAHTLPMNGSDNPDVVAKEQAKIQVRASAKAALSMLRGGKIDPKKMIDAAKAISSALGDLVGATKSEADKLRGTGQLSDLAEAALSLDDLLSSLQNAAAGDTSNAPLDLSALDGLLSSLADIKLDDTPAPAAAAAPVAAAKPKAPGAKPTLDESLMQVAKDLQQAVKSADASDASTTTTRNLANELERLANAARNNKRQEVLISGRSIAALVTQMCDQLRSAAKESNTALVQDKLIKSSQALKNFAIQLKILASVKAASETADNDADEQLGTLTRNFGSQMNEGLKSLDIHKKTHRAKK